jgi:hypothetical protein
MSWSARNIVKSAFWQQTAWRSGKLVAVLEHGRFITVGSGIGHSVEMQMPIYYFEITRCGKTFLDEAGLEFDSIDDAWEEATAAVGRMVKELDGELVAGTGCSIAVQDEFFNTIRTLNVSVVGPTRWRFIQASIASGLSRLRWCSFLVDRWLAYVVQRNLRQCSATPSFRTGASKSVVAN